MGWAGLAVSEANGGQGFGVSELCVVLEELGRAVLPGPLLTSAVVATALDRWGDAGDVLRALLDGAPVGSPRCNRLSTSRAEPSRAGRRRCGTARWPVGSSSRSRTRADAGGTCSSATTSPSPNAAASTPPGGWRRSTPTRCRSSGRTGSHPTPRPGAVGHPPGQRRGPGRGRLVRVDRGRVRRGAGAVRTTDRAVPGGEAPLRRHAHEARGGRAAVWDAARAVDEGDPSLATGRRHRRCACARRRLRRAPRTASRCSVASATRGSTTRTSS